MSKEVMEKLHGEVVELTRVMAERAEKHESEVKELGEKLKGLLTERKERKFQFETAGAGLSIDAQAKRVVEEKMDELYIASVLCSNMKSLGAETYASIVKRSDYAGALDMVKATGFDFGGVDSTDTNGGDAIPPGFSQTMLTDIYLALEIAGLFGRLPMPTASYTWPFATGRFPARLTAEKAGAVKDSIDTSQIIFTAKKLMATVDFTDEIQDDAVAALLPFVRAELVNSFALAQEQVAFNGDTTAGAGNLNGNIDADDARRLQKGLRALLNAGEKVDFSTGGIDAAGNNLRSLREKMGKYGKNPSELAYILSMADYLKTLKMTGYQALYQYNGAVTTTGELGRLDNIPLIITELVPTDLDAAGVYNAAGTKTTCGLVNRKAYMWGDRKQFGLETFRNPLTQVTSLIGSERLDFKKVLPAAAPTAAFGVNY